MNKSWDERMDEMTDAVDEACGGKSVVYYSAYPTSGATDLPLNNLNKIAIRGKVILHEAFDDFWGGEGKDYQSETLENPTWLEVAVVADAMIRTTNDNHHIFLEGVYPAGKKIDGVKVYSFAMGS